MSLKAFHVVFVSASILLSVGFGAFATQQYVGGAGMGYLGMAVGSFAAVGALVWYGTWFLKKLQHESYL